MKTVKSLVLTVLIGASIVACKKGDNDPFLSLRSRDARVAGEWKLDSWSSKEISTFQFETEYDTISYESNDFDGANLRYFLIDSVDTLDLPNSFSLDLVMDKDGTFTRTTEIEYDTYLEEGNWTWTNDGKNKTGIAFDDQDGAYDVLELRNKKMVLTKSSQEMYTDSAGAILTTTYSEKRTYIQE